MADYPITAVDRRTVLSGSAGTGPYAFNFPVLTQTDLDVYKDDTKLTLTNDYTVSIGVAGTGSITLAVAATVSNNITIVGARAIQRTTDFVTAGDFLASSLNTELDSQTIFAQQTSEDADRAIKAPVTDPTSIDMTLPLKTTRATKAMGFDSNGNPVVSTLTLAAMEAGSTEAASSATAAAASATASANSATASASSATAAATSAASAEGAAGTQNVDRFNGTGSQTAFTLSSAPATENNTSVYVAGVYQQKDTYSLSGTTLTFSTAPPSATGNVEVMHLSTQSIGVDPSIGTVTTGAAGSSAAASITSGGVLSFTIPQGDDGATGSQGATGAAATITVGSTTTGNAGTNASVVNSGSSSAANFNFTIPKGDQGVTGTAATIAVGTVTTGAAGSSATVVNGGSSSAATFNFTIPKGDTGNTGSTGSTGTAATIAAGSATGLSAGASPTVTNSGSSSAATFNFGIPAGATGSTGSAATIAVGSTTTGAAGSSASVANSGSSSAATFNFTIPKGDTGTTGTAATIAAGSATGLATGASPTVTNSGSSSAATFNFGIPAGATGSTGTAATIAVGSVTTGAAGSSATVTNSGTSAAATFDFAIPQGAAGTGSGDVTGPASATDNAVARFDATTGKLLQNSTVTVSDAGAVTAGAITASSLALTTDLAIADGGTGASSASAARTALGVDPAGTDNSTNVTLAGTPDYITISGQTITRGAVVLTTDISGTLPIANGGTNATSASAARVALGAAASGANSDITSLTGLTTDLTVAQGGTGAGTFTANGLLVGNGTGAVTATAVGTSGQILTSNGSGSAPTFQAAAAGGATDINGLSDAKKLNTSTYGIGAGALTAMSAADDDGDNLAVGYNAGGGTDANGSNKPYRNIFLGSYAGYGVSQTGTTHENIAIGWRALYLHEGVSGSVLIGKSAGENLSNCSFNTGIGHSSLVAATTASQCTNIGRYSGRRTTTGSNNSFYGYDSGGTNTTGSNCSTFGYQASSSSATVSNEVTLGNDDVTKFRVPGVNFTVKDSTATDNYVLTVDANGEAGWEAAGGGATSINGLSDGVTNSSGATVGLGTDALANDDGSERKNTALGFHALKLTNSNKECTAVGYKAGAAAIGTGDANNARKNSFFGFQAGVAITTGGGNTFIGAGIAPSATTVDACTVVGKEAGEDLTTGQVTFFGASAGYTTTTGTNVNCFGSGAIASSATVSNQVILGDSNISTLRCQVQSISSLSDRRDKKDIEELPLGVDFINALKPVKFTWNMRDGAKVGQQEAGFIAQDLDQAQIDADAEDYLSLVLKDNPEKLEASYGKLVPVLVKAVQELSAEIATLKKEIKNGK